MKSISVNEKNDDESEVYMVDPYVTELSRYVGPAAAYVFAIYVQYDEH